jgi:hypothetical protein
MSAMQAAPLAAWLQALRPALLQACDDALPAAQLRAGVDLLSRLETRWLPPALVERMGDVARLHALSERLATQDDDATRAVLRATLEGLLHLHFDDLDRLLGETDPDLPQALPAGDGGAGLPRGCG